MSIERIGVLGAGVMGAGIAQAAAQGGIDVVLRDIKDEFVEGAISRIEKQLSASVEKKRITLADMDAALSHIKGTTEAGEMANADLVIEAVVEDIELKKKVFEEMGAICGPDTVFATNTSSMSVMEIADASGRPERFIGLHFFNPVHVMKLVEIVSTEKTEAGVLPPVRDFVEAIGKTAVSVLKDSPGFIVNRLLVPYLNEAVRLYEEGVASPEDIDTAVKLGLNYPMGPFQMLDMGGVDLTVTVLDYFSKEFGDSGYAPRGTLREMLAAGQLGRKSGKGFYDYNKQ
jgi:3-hydroxybutyryl-CoA dehydrogenase